MVDMDDNYDIILHDGNTNLFSFHMQILSIFDSLEE